MVDGECCGVLYIVIRLLPVKNYTAPMSIPLGIEVAIIPIARM